MAAWEAGVLRHPYSRVVSWEGSGHWVHQERVPEFNALVLDWIEGLPGETAASTGTPSATGPAS